MRPFRANARFTLNNLSLAYSISPCKIERCKNFHGCIYGRDPDSRGADLACYSIHRHWVACGLRSHPIYRQIGIIISRVRSECGCASWTLYCATEICSRQPPTSYRGSAYFWSARYISQNRPVLENIWSASPLAAILFLGGWYSPAPCVRAHKTYWKHTAPDIQSWRSVNGYRINLSTQRVFKFIASIHAGIKNDKWTLREHAFKGALIRPLLRPGSQVKMRF